MSVWTVMATVKYIQTATCSDVDTEAIWGIDIVQRAIIIIESTCKCITIEPMMLSEWNHNTNGLYFSLKLFVYNNIQVSLSETRSP